MDALRQDILKTKQPRALYIGSSCLSDVEASTKGNKNASLLLRKRKMQNPGIQKQLIAPNQLQNILKTSHLRACLQSLGLKKSKNFIKPLNCQCTLSSREQPLVFPEKEDREKILPRARTLIIPKDGRMQRPLGKEKSFSVAYAQVFHGPNGRTRKSDSSEFRNATATGRRRNELSRATRVHENTNKDQ